MRNWAEDVADFHYKHGIEYEGPVRNLPPDLAQFRNLRYMEEAEEFADCAATGDKVGCLDAIIDQIYIILGTAHLMGFSPEVLAEAFMRVHRANMMKELAHDGNPSKYAHLGQKRDIVKPKGWTPTDLTDLCQS